MNSGDGKLQSKFTGSEVKSLAASAKVDTSKVPMKEFAQGLKVEQEHADVLKGNERSLARVAAAHLRELPDYYTRLKKMEGVGKHAGVVDDVNKAVNARVRDVIREHRDATREQVFSDALDAFRRDRDSAIKSARRVDALKTTAKVGVPALALAAAGYALHKHRQEKATKPEEKAASLAKEALDLGALSDPSTWHAVGETARHGWDAAQSFAGHFNPTTAHGLANLAGAEAAGFGIGKATGKLSKLKAKFKGKEPEIFSGVHKASLIPGVIGGLGYAAGRAHEIAGEHPVDYTKKELKKTVESTKKYVGKLKGILKGKGKDGDKGPEKKASLAKEAAQTLPDHEREYQKAKRAYDKAKQSYAHGAAMATMENRLMSVDPAGPEASRFLTEMHEFHEGTADIQPKGRIGLKAYMAGYSQARQQPAMAVQ